MPRVRFVEPIEIIQGTMYDMVFKRSPKGNPIITKRPDMSNVQWSQAQKDQRRRIADANQYARAAMADAEVRALYEARAATENRLAYRIAVSDYCKGRNLLSR